MAARPLCRFLEPLLNLRTRGSAVFLRRHPCHEKELNNRKLDCRTFPVLTLPECRKTGSSTFGGFTVRPKYPPLRGNFCFAPSLENWLINWNDSTDIVLSSATNGRDGYSDLNFRCILGVASTAVSRLLLFNCLHRGFRRSFRNVELQTPCWEPCWEPLKSFENWSIQMAQSIIWIYRSGRKFRHFHGDFHRGFHEAYAALPLQRKVQLL